MTRLALSRIARNCKFLVSVFSRLSGKQRDRAVQIWRGKVPLRLNATEDSRYFAQYFITHININITQYFIPIFSIIFIEENLEYL